MATADETEEVEMMAEVMAELRKDAKALSKDLLSGIDAFDSLKGLTLFAALFVGLLAGAYWPGQIIISQDRITALILLLIAVMYVAVAAYSWRKHANLKKKYSKLLEISAKLGD